MKPRKRWSPLDKTTFRVNWNGIAWTLVATPKGDYPWLLYNDAGCKQQIGPVDVKEAQAMAEFCLEVMRLFPYLRGENYRKAAS